MASCHWAKCRRWRLFTSPLGELAAALQLPLQDAPLTSLAIGSIVVSADGFIIARESTIHHKFRFL